MSIGVGIVCDDVHFTHKYMSECGFWRCKVINFFKQNKRAGQKIFSEMLEKCKPHNGLWGLEVARRDSGLSYYLTFFTTEASPFSREAP